MRFVWTVLVLGALVGVGYVLAASFLFPSVEDPTDAEFFDVPDLRSATFEEAAGQLSELGMSLKLRGRMPHAETPEGTIVAQSPMAGQVARRGDSIAVMVSDGPLVRRVPAVAGFDGSVAAGLLASLGFEVDIVMEEDTLRTGVIGTEPEEGALVELPAEVRILVAELTPPDSLDVLPDSLDVSGPDSILLGSAPDTLDTVIGLEEDEMVQPDTASATEREGSARQ